ncbi:MAG: RNA polymerase sigma factor [Acidobacteria bacterium]|nr:RNA polymerase sigma factor [Acidobacteriota bacterium]
MDDKQELVELMIGYQAADRTAAEQLAAKVYPMLHRFYSSLGEYERADDLAQECWIRLHKARHSYRPPEPVLPWVFAIARHTRVDQFRKRARSSGREVAMEAGADFAAPAPEAEPTVLPLLEQLPASQKEVLLMLKVTGMSLEEVARATASTVGSVKQKAHRAYETLRRLMGEKS